MIPGDYIIAVHKALFSVFPKFESQKKFDDAIESVGVGRRGRLFHQILSTKEPFIPRYFVKPYIVGAVVCDYDSLTAAVMRFQGGRRVRANFERTYIETGLEALRSEKPVPPRQVSAKELQRSVSSVGRGITNIDRRILGERAILASNQFHPSIWSMFDNFDVGESFLKMKYGSSEEMGFLGIDWLFRTKEGIEEVTNYHTYEDIMGEFDQSSMYFPRKVEKVGKCEYDGGKFTFKGYCGVGGRKENNNFSTKVYQCPKCKLWVYHFTPEHERIREFNQWQRAQELFVCA